MKLAILSLLVALSMLQTASAYYYGSWGSYYPYYGYRYPYYGYGYGIYGKRGSEEAPPMILDKTACFYQKESSMLTCFGKSEKQECEATYTILDKMPYEHFGIGEYKEEASGAKKFALIPRKSDDTAWLDDYSIVDGEKKYYSMYQSNKFSDYGFKVKSAECFDKIFEILKKSTRHEKVYIQSRTGENAEFYLIGDVGVHDEIPEEEVSKRQFGGYSYYGRYRPYYGRYSYGRYNRYNYGRYNYGYNRYNRYRYGRYRYGRDADEEESVHDEMPEEMMNDLKASDDNMERIAEEIEKIKRDIDMIKLDTHEPEVRTRRSSMWTKEY